MHEDPKSAIRRLLPQAESLLCDLISIPSLSGEEEPAVVRMADAFEGLGLQAELRPISSSIKDDPDYSYPEAGIDYTGRHNLVVRAQGAGAGRSVILQTHLDVVPPGEWKEAFRPRVEDGVVLGRGACDCKGQAVALWLALVALDTAGVRLDGDVTAQFVVEEEIGGNGALACILDGDRADAAVILEATDFHVHPANRGACWFRIRLQGESVHMGRKHEGVSAFDQAVKVHHALMEYEKKLVAESRSQPLFERYEAPVQVNIGMVRAGEWPSMVPGECVIEGGVGFLPNKPMRVVQQELRQLLEQSDDPWIAQHARIDFPKLHNDAYAIDPAHSVVQALHAACNATGLPSEVFGWNVSCDARLYALRGKMPAVVFGPGQIQHAHSDHEQIRMGDVAKAAEALAHFMMNWCGVSTSGR
jgi:acetylornithine deacetylase